MLIYSSLGSLNICLPNSLGGCRGNNLMFIYYYDHFRGKFISLLNIISFWNCSISNKRYLSFYPFPLGGISLPYQLCAWPCDLI